MVAALKTLTIIFCLPLISVSCYSYRQLRQQDVAPVRTNDQRITPQTVYALNAAELPYEYRILKESGLYAFTSDSFYSQKIRLLPLEKYPVAAFGRAEALPVIVMTFGQVPLRLQEKYTFHYYMVGDGIAVKKDYELTIDRRVWFWDIFSFKKDRRNALAKNLYNIAKN